MRYADWSLKQVGQKCVTTAAQRQANADLHPVKPGEDGFVRCSPVLRVAAQCFTVRMKNRVRWVCGTSRLGLQPLALRPSTGWNRTPRFSVRCPRTERPDRLESEVNPSEQRLLCQIGQSANPGTTKRRHSPSIPRSPFQMLPLPLAIKHPQPQCARITDDQTRRRSNSFWSMH